MEKPIVRVPSNLNGPAFTMDGLVNFASRLGTGADKSTHARYTINYVDLYDLEAAYRTTWFRKICDIPPHDETRMWRQWNGANPDQVTKIDATEKRLGLQQKLAEARILARKDGGSCILIGGRSLGDAASELDPARVGVDQIEYLSVCSRHEITPHERNRDPSSAFYDEPKYYTLQGSNQTQIHPSRVIRFVGNPIRMAGHWDGWGESIWTEISQKVKDADRISAGIAAGVEEWKLDIYKLKNLAANLATGPGEELLMRRMSAVNSIKSSQNALMLDADDEYVSRTLAFAGLTDIQMASLAIMAGIADIPATRLLGKSPDGMNSTGDSDLRNYYDRIRSGQVMYLGPALAKLDEMIIRSSLGDSPDEVYYEWNPLYQMTEKEAADVEKIFAETAASYAGSALIPDDALTAMVRAGMVERGQWPDAQSAFDDAAKEPGILAEPTEAEMAEEEARTAIALAAANDPGNVRLKAANDALALLTDAERAKIIATLTDAD